MTNTIFQEVAENHDKGIIALVNKYKNSMPLEDIEKELQFAFYAIVSSICYRIEVEEREKEQENGLER